MYRELSIPGYHTVRHFDEISSTMDGARQLLSEQVVTGEWCGLVTAEHQSAGRGRQGRSWLSGERAFMGTFVFCTHASLAALAGYSLAVGVATASALTTELAPCLVKWPNDLVVVEGGTFRKLGGILIEVEDLQDTCVVLVGLGLNISKPPAEVAAIAASLEELSAGSLSKGEIARKLAQILLETHQRFVNHGGFSTFRDEWDKYSAFVVGKTELTIDCAKDAVSGVYLGVSESGALRLMVQNTEKLIHSGHIVKVKL